MSVHVLSCVYMKKIMHFCWNIEYSLCWHLDLHFVARHSMVHSPYYSSSHGPCSVTNHLQNHYGLWWWPKTWDYFSDPTGMSVSEPLTDVMNDMYWVYWSNIVCMCICCGCYASNSAYAICLTLCNVSESGMELLLWQSLTQSLMLFAKNWSDYGTTVMDKSVNTWLQEDRHHWHPSIINAGIHKDRELYGICLNRERAKIKLYSNEGGAGVGVEQEQR